MLDTRNDARIDEPHDTAVTTGPDQTPAPTRERQGLFDEITGGEALFLGLFWLIGTTLLMAIAPEPDPNAAQPPLNVALNITWNIGFIAALGGAATLRRLGLIGSVVAGGAMAVMAVFCGLEGHTGLWIPAQFLMGAGIFAYGMHRLRG